MITTPEALLRELQARGLADAAPPTDAPDDPREDEAARVDRPWFIGLLLGVSGWLAGLFTLGFVVLLFKFSNGEAAVVPALLLIAAAWGLFKLDRDGAFVSQLALALSIAGQCLLLFAINERDFQLGSLAASALVLQLALAAVMPSPLHRFLSTFFATIAWALTVRFALFGEPQIWRHEDGAASVPLAQSLVGWVLAWAPVGAAIVLLIRSEPAWIARRWQPIARPVLAGLIAGVGYATLASHPFESFRWIGDTAPDAAAPNWLALWPLLSALAALGGIAAAFALRHRALLGAGVLAALLHVSDFYYELGASLLLKSLLMLAMGGAMWLAARRLASTSGEHA